MKLLRLSKIKKIVMGVNMIKLEMCVCLPLTWHLLHYNFISWCSSKVASVLSWIQKQNAGILQKVQKGVKNQNSVILSKIDRNFSKVNQVILSSAPISMSNIKTVAKIHFEVSSTHDFQILF